MAEINGSRLKLIKENYFIYQKLFSEDFSPLLSNNPQHVEHQRKLPEEIEQIKMDLKNYFDSIGSVLEEVFEFMFSLKYYILRKIKSLFLTT